MSELTGKMWQQKRGLKDVVKFGDKISKNDFKMSRGYIIRSVESIISSQINQIIFFMCRFFNLVAVLFF